MGRAATAGLILLPRKGGQEAGFFRRNFHGRSPRWGRVNESLSPILPIEGPAVAELPSDHLYHLQKRCAKLSKNPKIMIAPGILLPYHVTTNSDRNCDGFSLPIRPVH
jgi:hypothetical protein